MSELMSGFMSISGFFFRVPGRWGVRRLQGLKFRASAELSLCPYNPHNHYSSPYSIHPLQCCLELVGVEGLGATLRMALRTKTMILSKRAPWSFTIAKNAKNSEEHKSKQDPPAG